MITPTTAWDREPTDAELNSFYGKPKDTRIADDMRKIICETVRKVPAKSLSLDYITYRSGRAELNPYPLIEVVTDYGIDPAPLAALIHLFERSDCPLVAAYRQALAARYIDDNALEVEEHTA